MTVEGCAGRALFVFELSHSFWVPKHNLSPWGGDLVQNTSRTAKRKIRWGNNPRPTMAILSVRSDQSSAQSSTLHAIYSLRFTFFRDIADRVIDKINYFEQKREKDFMLMVPSPEFGMTTLVGSFLNVFRMEFLSSGKFSGFTKTSPFCTCSICCNAA